MASAALYTDNLGDDAWQCNPARAQLPIMESHGNADGTIPYDGGEGSGGNLPSIPAWLDTWGQRDGCAANSGVSTDNGNGVHITEYSCNGVNNIVTGVEIDGLGHCWPINDGDATNTDSSKDGCGNSPLDYTPMVLSFFDSWDINGAISQ
jgi:poly(3-hydroxybutyrate) depolymerase